MPSMLPRRLATWQWIILSLFVTATLAVPLATVVVPPLHRWVALRRLTSEDPATWQRGRAYVAFRAPDDPRVRQAAFERLPELDDRRFQELVQTLKDARQWEHPPVPLGPWLRWIEGLSRGEQAHARINAVHLLADLHAQADDPRLPALLQPLLEDADPDVRLNALSAAAELAGAASRPQPYTDLIARMTADSNPLLASEAWLLLGPLAPASGIQATWRGQPLPVAQAMLYAALTTHPHAIQPAAEALLDPAADPRLRATAAWLLGRSPSPDARAALAAAIPAPSALSAPEMMVATHAILAAAQHPLPPDDPLTLAVAAHLPRPEELADPSDLHLAALFALPKAVPLDLPAWFGGEMDEDADEATRSSHALHATGHSLSALAALEGAAPASLAVALTPATPPLVRVAALAAMTEVRPEDFLPLLASPLPTVRDLGAVLAAERLAPAAQERLAAELLLSFDDDAKMGGAILAGLTGLRPQVPSRPRLNAAPEMVDLLALKAQEEDVWRVQAVLRLALWMQGRLPELDATVTDFLLRRDVPHSSVLLAMLHRGHPAALDLLLTPRTDEREFSAQALGLPGAGPDERVGLRPFLIHLRWQRVLSRYLPPGAPRPWLRGDPAVLQFQIDALRTWYVVHRHRKP